MSDYPKLIIAQDDKIKSLKAQVETMKTALEALSRHPITHAVGCSHLEETCSCHKRLLKKALESLKQMNNKDV